MFRLLALCLVISSWSSCSGMVSFELRRNAGHFHQAKIDESIVNFGLNLNKLLQQNAGEGENVVISPIGIYASMALTHLGANGRTRDEIGKVMGLPSNSQAMADKLHENLGNILKRLQDAPNANTTLINGIFLQNGYQLKDTFQKKLQSYYRNEVVNVDFNSDEVTEIVNEWFSKQTHDKIEQFFEEAIPRDTKLLLANALCFNSNWKQAFPVETTQQESFETENGQRESINMMRKTDTVPYYCDEQNRFEAVAIPNEQNDYQMYVVLPQQGQTLKNLSNLITNQHIQQIVSQSVPTVVDIKVPQMRLKTSDKIKQTLQQLGVNQLFDSPDLSNMIDRSNLRVSQVNYALEMEVNEQGIDVCAGTTQQYKIRQQQEVEYADAQKQFYLQKPFMFFVHHAPTKCVLFCGNIHQLSA